MTADLSHVEIKTLHIRGGKYIGGWGEGGNNTGRKKSNLLQFSC